MRRTTRTFLAGLCIASIYLSFRAFSAHRLAVLPDETYYWTWSLDPAGAYVDHPPGIAWILSLARIIFASGKLGIRTAALVASCGLLGAIVWGARVLGGSRAGLYAGLLLVGSPMFAVGGLVATPDIFLGALLGLGVALWSHAYRFSSSLTAALGTLCFSMAPLLKHAGGVLALGAFFGAATTPEGRRLLRSKKTILAAGSGAVLVGLWLAQDLSASASFSFQGARVMGGSECRALQAPVLVALALVITASPVGFLLVSDAVVRGWRSGPVERTFAASAGALLVLCLVPAGRGTGEWHWVFPAAIVLLPVAGARIAGWPGAGGHRLRRASVVVAGVGVLLSAHAAFPRGHPLAKRDPTLRGWGYPHIAREVLAQALAAEADVVLTRSYQLASLLRFHLQDQLPVLELGVDRASQYDRWPKPQICVGDRVVVVLREGDDLRGLPFHQEGKARILERRIGSQTLSRLQLWAGRLRPVENDDPEAHPPRAGSVRQSVRHEEFRALTLAEGCPN